MAIVTVNFLAVLVEHANESGTELNTLIGTNFTAEKLREGWARGDAAIVYMLERGEQQEGAPITDIDFAIRCYGKADNAGDKPTLNNALTVYRAFNDQFHEASMKPTASGMLMQCKSMSMTTLIDPDLNMPYIVARYTAQIRND